MAKRRTATAAEILLGKRINKLRKSVGMSESQLGREINKLEQQIRKYEAGEFVPLPVLEQLARTLGAPIAKKLIRKISSFRLYETETGEEQKELIMLYNQLLCED